MVKQIGAETLSEKAYIAIRDSILRNELLPGTPVSVDSLASDLGISPTPVREAVARLVAGGLIDHEPRKGMRVVDLTEEDVREAYEVRRILEPHVARMAAESAGDDAALRSKLQSLIALASEVQEAAAHGGAIDPVLFNTYTEIDLGLNDLLLNAISNSLLRAVFTLTGNRSLRIRSFVEATFARCEQGTVFALNDEHIKILQALLEGRGHDAERLTALHLDQAETRTLGALKELASLKIESEIPSAE